MSIQRRLPLSLLIACLAAALPGLAAAQAPLVHIPINGFNATIALPSSVDKFYSDVETALVKSSDGVEHIVDKTKGTTVHGSRGSLDSLQPGTAVMVHYTVKGIAASADDIDRIGREELKVNEGTVARVDRDRKRITIAFANGTTETLRLAHPVYGESGAPMERVSRVIVFYPDQTGRRVAQSFKPVH
jgi:hypothetical protein